MLAEKDIELLDPSNGENPYPLSTSREWDAEASQYYYRARYYEPVRDRLNIFYGLIFLTCSEPVRDRLKIF